MSVRKLEPGTEVSITGERGRFRFQGESVTGAGKLVYHFIGGMEGHEQMRSFYPSRIKRVHRINKTRASAQ
ncbi:MAG TPA: hypothetical protein VF221_01605 [Chloroflexota bacterium]